MLNCNNRSSYLSEINKRIVTLEYDIPRISNEDVRKKKKLDLKTLQEELNALINNDEEGVM